MRTCIICLESKPTEAFNREHVFPETIGGNYIIHTVCKVCNESMGDNIDTPFTCKHEHVVIFRNKYQLHRKDKRRRNNIPKSFATFNKMNKDEKIEWDGEKFVRRIKRKLLQPKMVEVNGKMVDGFTYSTNYIDNSTMQKEMEHIMKKVAEKNNVPVEEIKCEITFQPNDPNPKPEEAIGSNNLVIMEAIKIAYEFTATNLEDYLVDPVASYYRSMLRSGNINRIFLRNHYLDLKQAYLSIDQQYIDAVIQNHVVFLYYVDGIGLIATVKFFTSPPFFYSSFLMSASEKYQTLPLIGLINDFQTKQIYFL